MKIGITGCTGRVGALLVSELLSGNWEGLSLAGGTARGKDHGYDFFVTDDAAALFEASDLVIDFTTPEATREHIKLAAATGTPMVIGTTGLSAEDEATLKEAAQKAPIVYASNTSVGITLLLDLVQKAAATLGSDWDIEIFEAHHKHKIDAPSGTALSLGKAAQAGRNGGEFVHERTGKRQAGDIGYAVSRGGDVVGEHDVTFFAEGERLTLSHKATNRALFARGALRAATWLAGQKSGLYSMKDVLGL